MSNFEALLAAARNLTSEVEVRFCGTADGAWELFVCVGPVIIVQSQPGQPEQIIDETARKLRGMSDRVRLALGGPTGPST